MREVFYIFYIPLSTVRVTWCQPAATTALGTELLLPSVPAREGRRWNVEVACLLAQVSSGNLVQLVYSRWIPLGNADSLSPHLGSSRSRAGTGQLFVARSCRAELLAVCFWFDLFSCFLHLPNVPQPLIVKPYAEFQRCGGRWRINTPISGRCEEEPGAVTSSSSWQTSKSHPPLGSIPLPPRFP